MCYSRWTLDATRLIYAEQCPKTNCNLFTFHKIWEFLELPFHRYIAPLAHVYSEDQRSHVIILRPTTPDLTKVTTGLIPTPSVHASLERAPIIIRNYQSFAYLLINVNNFSLPNK